MDPTYVTQETLAARWGLKPRTLERWRWLRQGPAYLKIGGRIRYRLIDIERYEADSVRESVPVRERVVRP